MEMPYLPTESKVIGFDPKFLCKKRTTPEEDEQEFKQFGLSLPVLGDDAMKKLLIVDKRYVFDYLHFSSLMSLFKQSLIVVHHTDGALLYTGKRIERPPFYSDPRVGINNQLAKGIADALVNHGHQMPKKMTEWGSSKREVFDASTQSFCKVNVCLQHKSFNQDKWLIPERKSYEYASQYKMPLTIFTMAIYLDSDPEYKKHRVASGFAKVIVLRMPQSDGQDKLAVATFVMFQAKNFKRLISSLKPNELYQTPLRLVEMYTDVKFCKKMHQADVLNNPLGFNDILISKPIESSENVIFCSDWLR